MKKNQLTGVIITLAVFLLIFLLATQKTGFEGIDAKLEESADEFYTTKLDNGLTITVKEISNLNLVTIQFWVKTGSKNENDENRGISHIFEHIWFKGTERQPAGSFDKTIASYGGYANAMTGQDLTVFYTIVPSEKFEETLDLMADLFKNQAFDKEEIAKEKEVILEEQRIIHNDPKSCTDEEFAKLLLLKHPYRNPILGYTETIKAATPEKIKEYYKTWYAPNNINLIVVGDIKPATVITSAEQFLGDIKTKKLPVISISPEAEQKNLRFGVGTRKGLENTYIAVGYRTAGFENPDWYALRLLIQMLDGAENSRLTRIVKNEKELILKSETYYVPLKDLGALETLITIKPEKETKAIQAVLDEYNRFKEQLVTNEELEAAKKQLQAGYARQQEEIVQQGIDIGRWWTSGNFEKQPYYLQDMNKISKEDIMKTAKKYLKQPVIYVLKPT